ncbi:hypothetical protein AXG93_2779s1150 [Marchantia polymorpha subsp. ruderalis]|uniref:Uncharacterized protein n=1 Tax=Marchantia polymorpha subsp. ruderalis TaxID=1480154 RepID=A0A176W3F0_MARPO|nr:hypothetical protein AXG93_2779s1150 [Marchantia polymorpha subsp. ruderalis]
MPTPIAQLLDPDSRPGRTSCTSSFNRAWIGLHLHIYIADASQRLACLLEKHVDGVDDSGDVTQNGEQQADPELDSATELEENSQRRQDDGQNDVDTESRNQFEANRHLAQPEEIDRKIFEGESRHDIAWHYKIPYPRLHNFSAGTFTEKPSRIAGPSFEISSDEMGTVDDKPSKPSGLKGRLPSSSLTMRS